MFKMSPVFPTLTVAKPLVTKVTSGCRMKDLSIDTLWFTVRRSIGLSTTGSQSKVFFEMFKKADNEHI